MFFVTYLGRELRRRARQATFIALGLALGVGLVVTVSAASTGIQKAQSSALSSLYGVGTDIAVNGGNPGRAPGATPPPVEFGKTFDNLSIVYAAITAWKVAQVGRLHDVTAAVGVLSLSDTSITFRQSAGPDVSNLTIDGVEPGDQPLGPLSSARLISGRVFTAADSTAAVAVVDSNYAKSHGLEVGSAITIDGASYTVIGIVGQAAQSGTPTDVYVPLARAQTMSGSYGPQTNDVNTIYLSVASAADVETVQKEIKGLLPGTTVTTESSLASEVTGSLSTASTLVNELGRWLSLLTLIAAFAVASLLTMAAVGRRAREFGTLKAIGWRSSRIVAQVLGESVAVGMAGAAAGVGLGYAGAAIIVALAPSLAAKVPEKTGNSGGQVRSASAGSLGGTTTHLVHVPVHAAVTVHPVVLAVALAVFGGLLAGLLGSWRIARLRPADALARIG